MASPTPYVVPPTSKFEGNDGSWSTFYINVGYPTGQNFRVLVSTASSLTWVINTAGCTSGDPSNCPDLRGVENYAGAKSSGYNPSDSTNSSQIGLYGLKLEDATDFSTIYGPEYSGINASIYEDVIGLGEYSPTSLELDEYLGSVASKSIFLGEFGLGINPNNFGSGDLPTFVGYLPNCSMPIPSSSYGYTAGASYRKDPIFIHLQIPRRTSRFASYRKLRESEDQKTYTMEETVLPLLKSSFLPYLCSQRVALRKDF
jgi:hypothetical protein